MNVVERRDARLAACWPAFADIPEPRMVCFGTGNGSGTKLFQAYLDGHPQIYMVAAYQLLYFYPHWEQWREELAENWSWPALIDALCTRHASLFDSRRIPGHDGLATLGPGRDRWLEVEERVFRAFLAHLLEDEPISSRTFLLAVHYAYAFARGEGHSQKRILVYHIHIHEYVPLYLAPDFADMLTIAFVRDPRSNIKGRFHSMCNIEDEKLNRTDAVVYRRRTFATLWEFFTESLQCLAGLDPSTVRVVRHEDMLYRREDLMRATAAFLGIDDHACLRTVTFGGLAWWGDKIYDMRPMNEPNPRVVSGAWRRSLPAFDRFVLEGLFHDYCERYGYERDRIGALNGLTRAALRGAMLLPMQYERHVIGFYVNPITLVRFLVAAWREASGREPLIDYAFNAYYRHKWCNRGLDLHRPRWHRRVLTHARDRLDAAPTAFGRRLAYRVAQGLYVGANLVRYVGSIASLPVLIARRGRLSWRAFRRSLRGAAVLPEMLP